MNWLTAFLCLLLLALGVWTDAHAQARPPYPFPDSLLFAGTSTSSALPTHTAPRGGAKAATQRRAELNYERYGSLAVLCQVPELDGSAAHDSILRVEFFQETGGWAAGQSPPGTDIRWSANRHFFLSDVIGDSMRFIADTAQSSMVKIRCTYSGSL